ncbi:CDP-alcohol phosphatidyltransferase family protein [Rubripirellula amarantea]|nr:CDP-alcohol phosphatidyltransferase family protein [Rubripirellula amarantea]
MSKRISYSLLDPWIGPLFKKLYPRLSIPAWFPPEGIVLIGHLSAIAGAIGFAFALQFWWCGILGSIGVVGNHLADCIDGTHARETGQCRNGGELLDHFTDPLSFAYWLIGIGVAINRLDLAIVAVVCLFATAVLTNIKAKLIGEFTLAKFGPTEFKTLLAVFGSSLSVAMGVPALSSAATPFATTCYVVLILGGLVQLTTNLVLAVREVNRSNAKPDTSEWITTRTHHSPRIR